MITRTILIIWLALSVAARYTKRHSPLVDNTVYFFRRLQHKLGGNLNQPDTNPIFYNAFSQYKLGVCSSKMGPKCAIRTPGKSFTNNPLAGILSPEQTVIWLKAIQTARIQAPYMDRHIRQASRLIFLPTDANKDYDKILQSTYE